MQILEVKCLNEVDPIVIVDDNVGDLIIASRVYRRSELKNPLLTFESGEAFIEYMMQVKAGEAHGPVMVLMDINMPGGMNGFETIQTLRQYEEFADIPIIVMLTHSDSMDDVENAFKVGANGFQTKDFTVDRYVEFFNALKPDSKE